jgi:hypothetical protein
MEKPNYKELLASGVHFGHLKNKWNLSSVAPKKYTTPNTNATMATPIQCLSIVHPKRHRLKLTATFNSVSLFV